MRLAVLVLAATLVAGCQETGPAGPVDGPEQSHGLGLAGEEGEHLRASGSLALLFTQIGPPGEPYLVGARGNCMRVDADGGLDRLHAGTVEASWDVTKAPVLRLVVLGDRVVETSGTSPLSLEVQDLGPAANGFAWGLLSEAGVAWEVPASLSWHLDDYAGSAPLAWKEGWCSDPLLA